MEDRLYMEGSRLFLQEMRPEDITESMMAWFQDSDLMRFYTNSGRKIDKAELIHSMMEGRKNKDNYTLGIYAMVDNSLIGTVKLGHINWRHRVSDLATLIGDKRFHGKGLAADAVALGTRIAFDVLDLRALHTSMYVSNIASIKAYIKAGWVVEGRIRGYYMVDGRSEDQILEGCYNPLYFREQEIMDLRTKSSMYYEG